MKTRLTAIVTVTLVLFLLAVSAGQAAPDKRGGGVHVVQWGENLATIAYRYGLPVAALAQANGIYDPNLIYIGQQLVIPTDGDMAMAAGPANPSGPPGPGAMPQENAAMMGPPPGQTYTVRMGDTLTALAFRYGTSINALMQANGLYDGNILIGQQLVIPGGGAPMPAQAGVMPAQGGPLLPQAGAMPAQGGLMPAQGGPMSLQGGPAPGLTYNVRPGDTLSAIAYRYGTSVSDLMQMNNLYNPWILAGQNLVIPGGMAVGPQQPAGTFYQVRPGDTLAGIALLYGTTVQNLLQTNNLSQAQFIQPGQELVIPGTLTPAEAVRVPPGPMVPMPQGTGPTTGAPVQPQGKAPTTLQGKGAENAPFTIPIPAPDQAPKTTAPKMGTAPMTAPMAPGVPQGYGLAPMVPGAPQGYGMMPAPVEVASGVLLGDDPSAAAARFSAPVVTMKWTGHMVSQTFPENSRYPSVLRVSAGGAPGMAVTISKQGGNWSTTGFTGTKPEYGNGTVEFAPLNPGRYNITLDGQGGSMAVNIKPNSLTYVEFGQVPTNNGPYDGPYSQ